MPQRTLAWQPATVLSVKTETPRVKSFRLGLSTPGVFKPGQHYDVRLTAPDGYQAQRSYSIASSPGSVDSIELTVEVIEDGEVSPYFHEVVREGDEIEVRGPIGGPFTWNVNSGGPVLLIGGGSGVVPLMSMLRHRAAESRRDIPASLLYSSRSMQDVIYREELQEMAKADENFQLELTLTREQPPNWSGHTRRVDAAMIKQTVEHLGEPAFAFVCGPTGFVESVSNHLLDLGMSQEKIRTERFGPSGT